MNSGTRVCASNFPIVEINISGRSFVITNAEKEYGLDISINAPIFSYLPMEIKQLNSEIWKAYQVASISMPSAKRPEQWNILRIGWQKHLQSKESASSYPFGH